MMTFEPFPWEVEEYQQATEYEGVYGNSSCSQWTTCSPCVDSYSGDDERCLWCKVPKDGGDAMCVVQSEAQEQCELVELEVSVEHTLHLAWPRRMLSLTMVFHFLGVTSLRLVGSDTGLSAW